MADRRMFSRKIIESDRFLDLPPVARLFYYDLCIRCDDDGFCPQPGGVRRTSGASPEDYQLLLDAKLVLDFDGIAVVRDWRVHNTLKSDRLRAPGYSDIADRLWIARDGYYTTDQAEGLMTLTEYHARYAKERRDPLRNLPEKCSETVCNLLDPEEKRTEEKKKEENRTKMKRDEEEAACALAGEGPDGGGFDGGAESEDSSSDDKRLETFGGELGQNVVWLTDEQTSDLLDRLSLEEFDRYVRKLSDYILQHGDRFHSHYKTILKWWEEDRAVDKTGKARESPDRWPRPKQQPWQRAMERPWEPPRGEFHEPPF